MPCAFPPLRPLHMSQYNSITQAIPVFEPHLSIQWLKHIPQLHFQPSLSPNLVYQPPHLATLYLNDNSSLSSPSHLRHPHTTTTTTSPLHSLAFDCALLRTGERRCAAITFPLTFSFPLINMFCAFALPSTNF